MMPPATRELDASLNQWRATNEVSSGSAWHHRSGIRAAGGSADEHERILRRRDGGSVELQGLVQWLGRGRLVRRQGHRLAYPRRLSVHAELRRRAWVSQLRRDEGFRR